MAFLHFPARGGAGGSGRGLPTCRPGLAGLFGSAISSCWIRITPPWAASAGRGSAPSHHPRPPDRAKQTTFEPRCENFRDESLFRGCSWDGNRNYVGRVQCILGLGYAACHLILSHHHTTSTLKTHKTHILLRPFEPQPIENQSQFFLKHYYFCVSQYPHQKSTCVPHHKCFNKPPARHPASCRGWQRAPCPLPSRCFPF